MNKKNKSESFYGYIVVAAAFAIVVIGVGGSNSFGVFLKPLLVEFGWTRATTAGAFSLAALVSGSVCIGIGRLTDRFGPRLPLTVSGLFWGLGYLLMSQINAIWQLYLFYGVIMGIGYSGFFTPLLSTIAKWFAKKRGTMTGIVLSGIGVGSLIMPPLTAWLISNYGWRHASTVLGITSLIIIVSAAQFLRRDPQSKGQLPDGETAVKQQSSNLGVTGFSLQEAMCTRQLWLLGLTMVCLAISLKAIQVHIVIHTTGLGIPIASAVTVLAIAGGVNIAGMFVIGTTADRIGNKQALIIALGVLLASLVWLQFAKELWMLYLFAVIFGFVWGGAFVPISPMVAELYGMRAHGVLFGFINLNFAVGSTIGPVLLGYIFDITGSYQLGLLLLSIVSLICLTLALLLQPIRKKKVLGIP